MALNKVSSPSIYTSQYSNLKGCDFSVSDTEVSRYRSPDALNMISNDGGSPVKRKGYRDVFGNPFNSARSVVDITTWKGFTFVVSRRSSDGHYIVSKVLTWKQNNQNATYYDIAASIIKPLLYTYGSGLYAFIDNAVCKLETNEVADEQPYIPEVTIGLSQDGSGGTSLYDVNILTKYRTYSYNFNSGLGSGTQTVRLFPEGTTQWVAYEKIVSQGGTTRFVPLITVEYLDATTGEWTELTIDTSWDMSSLYDFVGINDNGKPISLYATEASEIRVYNADSINFMTGLNRDNFRVTFATFDISPDEAFRSEYQTVNCYKYPSNDCVFTIEDEAGRTVRSGLLSWDKAYTLTITGNSLSGTLSFRGNDYEIVDNSVTVPFNPDQYYNYAVYRLTSVGNNHNLDLYVSSSLITKKGMFTQKKRDLMSATSVKAYGYSSFNRLFFAGGSLGNNVYYTEADNPTYVPDLNYLVIGNDDNSVAGLHRKGQYLCAIKENEGSEPTMVLINGALTTMDTEEYEYFRVTSTSANIGAYNTKCFATLIDDPMFLTRAGIYGISTISTTSETVLRERSTLLNRKLLAEENLANAIAFTYDMYYFLLCPNGHGYVLDGRQATTSNVNGNTDFVYEGYYWEGLPQNVTCAYANSDGVMFGTASGRIYKFNTDISDSTAYNDNGQPIHASWSTPMDGDYKPHYLKTMQKKGTMITLEPYERTSCRTTIVKDGADRFELEPFNSSVGIVDFSNVGNFSYNFYEVASDMFLKKKLKKYKRMQIVVENSNLNEPFGIQDIIKSYTVGSYAKK